MFSIHFILLYRWLAPCRHFFDSDNQTLVILVLWLCVVSLYHHSRMLLRGKFPLIHYVEQWKFVFETAFRNVQCKYSHNDVSINEIWPTLLFNSVEIKCAWSKFQNDDKWHQCDKITMPHFVRIFSNARLKGLRMVARALWRSEARKVVPWSETLHEP